MGRQARTAITGNGFRDLIAEYIHHQYGSHDLVVYREVNLGKTIIAKDRQIDVFVMRPSDQKAIAIECKYQDVQGTADEKIPYALDDLAALWVPGCLVYAGRGWSKGVLHQLEASRLAAYCLPERPALSRSKTTASSTTSWPRPSGSGSRSCRRPSATGSDPDARWRGRAAPRSAAAAVITNVFDTVDSVEESRHSDDVQSGLRVDRCEARVQVDPLTATASRVWSSACDRSTSARSSRSFTPSFTTMSPARSHEKAAGPAHSSS